MNYDFKFAKLYSSLHKEAKLLFEYMARVKHYAGSLSELALLCGYDNFYKVKDVKRLNISQFRRLGIFELSSKGLISYEKQPNGRFWNIDLI